MLQNIRDKSQGIVVKIIVGFIVVTFALFGVDALVTSFNSSNTVAEVNGTEITRTELLQTAESQRRQLIAMMGAQIDPALLDDNLLQRRALDELIQRAVLADYAASLTLAVSEAQTDQYLVQLEQFQTEGRFDQNKYLTFIQTLGYSPLAFKQRVQQDLLLEQARSAILASEFVLPSQVAMVSALQNQQRSFDYLSFSLAAETEVTDVTDEEVVGYYELNQSQFSTPEQVKVDYVVISAESFADKVAISEAELQVAYDAATAQGAQEERLASHILLELTDERSLAQAQEQIDSIRQQLDSGRSFAELARQYSDDLGSKMQGGYLGYISQGSMVEAFEQTLFSMKVNDVAIAQTEFGVHLIQLNDVILADVPSLDDIRYALEQDLLQVKTRDALLSAHEEITDLAYASDRLEPLAQEFKVDILQTDFFSRQGGFDEVASNAQVIAAAFSPQVLEDGQNSNLIELSDEKVVILRLHERQAESVLSLDQARDQVVSQLVQDKAQQALRQKAELALSQPEEQAWQRVNDAQRGMDEVTSLAFAMPHPKNGVAETAIETTSTGDLVLIRLLDVKVGEMDENEQQLAFYKRYLTQVGSTLASQAQETFLTNSANIER